MKKRVLSVLLVICMLFAIAGCGSEKVDTNSTNAATEESEASAYPEYLNLDSYFPIVKEGYDVTLKVVIIDHSSMLSYPAEERYYTQMVEELMNIKLDITEVPNAGAEEYINMLFASDDLPDLLLTTSALSPEQLSTYGVSEGQLLDFAPYMKDTTLMPGFNAVLEKNPTMMANLTAPNGAIYSQVLVADADAVGYIQRRTVNEELLKEVGVGLPTTLDEFTDAMYKVKAAYPDMIPLGGTYKTNSVHGIILNALGFNDAANNGADGLYTPGVRNGAVTVPAADKEIYSAFVSTMKKYFDDGIISRDYFSMDTQTSSLNARNGLYAVWTGWVNPSDYANVEKYNQLPALTSEYNDNAFVGHPLLYTTGRVVASAKTKYPEVIARFCDYTYTDEGNTVYQIGFFDTEDHKHLALEGWGGAVLNENGALQYNDCMPDEGKAYDYSHTKNGAWSPTYEYKLILSEQGMGSRTGQIPYRMMAGGYPEIRTDYENWKAEENTADAFWRADAYDTYIRNEVREYGLPIMYFSVEESTRISELKSVLQPHMETETIKFITGERDLSEIETYFGELEALGYQEYIGYYQTGYDSYLENM